MNILPSLEVLLLIILVVSQLIFMVCMFRQQRTRQAESEQNYLRLQEIFSAKIHQLHVDLQQIVQFSQQHISKEINLGQLNMQSLVSDSIQRQMSDIREQITNSFKQHATSLSANLQTLTAEVQTRLDQLTGQVNLRLSEGFEKTSSTFTDVVRRLTIIDEAQKKINELSTHVVNLQDILVDKRARGAFGEVQLATLIANMIPPAHYGLQHTLSNQKRVDCMLFLPQPTGHIAIDAKFPLETYQKWMHPEVGALEKKSLQQLFRQDLQKHVKDIHSKYIIPGETADGAIMFIPAEAIFAEIHASYPEVITMAQRLCVWIVSPSTLMAVLTTAKAVLKDDATRKQVHIIQKHLQALADDFNRFESRMDKLSKHIQQAHQDVDEVNTSAKKITQRFQKIDAVELDFPELPLLDS